MRRLIGTDPLTGVSSYHEHDALTDTTTIIHSGDCEPYLEANKKLSNDTEYTKQGFKNGWWKYASIPPAIQVKWLLEKGVDVYNKDHGPEILKLINDPEYRFLKTTSKYHA